jgi:hypothetical protein
VKSARFQLVEFLLPNFGEIIFFLRGSFDFGDCARVMDKLEVIRVRRPIVRNRDCRVTVHMKWNFTSPVTALTRT